MIRYKITSEKNMLICEKKDRKQISFIREEKVFIELINRFIKNGYSVAFDGKNVILSGEDAYIYIENYNILLASPCLRHLRDDMVRHILSEGYTKSSDKRSKKKKRFRDYSKMEKISDTNSLRYFKIKDSKSYGPYFRPVVGCILLVVLALRTLPVLSSFFKASLKMNFDSNADPSDSISLYLEESASVEIEEILTTEEPVVEENHDEEYREAIYNFLVKEKMTLEQFSSLLTAMVKGNSPFPFEYETELDVFLDICFREDRSTDEMMLITMIRDNITYDELDATCAGCVAEAHGDGYCYEDAFAVASTIINRIHDSVYVNNYGKNPFNQFKAPRQFSVYKSGAYLDYLGCRDLPGYQAAVEAFYTGESMHNFLEFRGWWVDVPYYHEQFVEKGNQYLVIQKEYRHLEDEEFVVDEEEIMSLVLEP